ncbi:MAG TPA: hypothetical protein VGS07_05940 [Thermoanaerobaculia bacterium]|nr:hypothetical protein [Thermoanaerobaculia bacterium]
MPDTDTPSRHSPWSVLRTGLLFALASAFALGAAPGWAGAPPAPPEKAEVETASWTVLDAVTTVGLNAETLSGLGLEVTTNAPSGRPHSRHPLSVVSPNAPSFDADGPIVLRAAVATDGFHGFESGPLYFHGGLLLHGEGRLFDLSSLVLRPGQKTTTLELVDASGVALLTTADAQWEFDAKTGQLRYLNADLRILPALAHLLGEDRYAGLNVGVLDLDATLKVGRLPAAPLPPVGAVPPACGDWSGTVDVALTNMSSIGQAGIATVNGRSVVVVLPSADLKNVGTANVPWYSKFTNLGVPPWNDQHPFLVWQMERSNAGVLEPLGRSDLKHAFLTLNNGCDAGACTNSHILGLGCTDVYGTGTNNDTGSLAPRSEVTASTGIWSHCGGIPSHFDTNGDCTQDFFGSGENAFTHGLKAAETDLQIAGATYYVEAFYIIRDDRNIFNSMGYRQVTPTKPGSIWSFPTVGAYSQGPAINAWVNPTTPGPNADNKSLDTGEGHVQLAVRVTDVAGSPGRKRYAYALQNHDFDRRIKSFSVPFNTAAGVIENIAYSDGDGFAANDWTATIDANGITWTAPAATTPPAEIDYATMVSFRFDSNQAAAAAQSTLGVFEAGTAGAPMTLQLQTLAPAGVGVIHGFYTITPCRLLDTRNQPAGPIASGVVREVAVSGCGVPATATAVAINVTTVGPTSSGDLAVYAVEPPTAANNIVSFGLGAIRANNAIAQISATGTLKIKPTLGVSASTHVLVDVVGYFQ